MNALSLELIAIIGLGLAVIAVGATLSAQLAFATRRIHADREETCEDRSGPQRAVDESGTKCIADRVRMMGRRRSVIATTPPERGCWRAARAGGGA